MTEETRPELDHLRQRLAQTLDEQRTEQVQRRHQKDFRTARENLADLVDEGTFTEYGQLAVAAQRSRRELDDLQTQTAADGVITGIGEIDGRRCAVVIYDYSVLAGTQGYFHHQKLDRIFELARQWRLPVVLFAEGGGGRPGDTDVTTQIAGLNLTSFSAWARLEGLVPRVAIANGYCFAGNAALFGCADITIATRDSSIGMAGPAMIQGGGLGVYEPAEIGPLAVQEKNGVVDLVAEDEAHATVLARTVLGYFGRGTDEFTESDQSALRAIIPTDRRWGYPVRKIIETLADENSFTELQRAWARPVVTGFVRFQGRAVGLIANDCQQLGGAVDAIAAQKAARFLGLCETFSLPVLSLVDTPGFMVGPDSEKQAAVRHMSGLFAAGARLTVPLVTVFLRKAYGLGAMAMAGGSFSTPLYAMSWPTGEFGAMGLEGAVRLGYRKELDAISDEQERQALFDSLVAKLYDAGRATEAAAFLEIDAVIDPADTRKVIIQLLAGNE